jgi:hypothetical protein
MRRKENKKHSAVHKTVIATPRKPERVKEIPDFDDPETEVEDAFDILVHRLQLVGAW